ncbi:MAG: type I 3-dehydroquinate dehydratase [Candidatus Baldrarchaeia archaeon]
MIKKKITQIERPFICATLFYRDKLSTMRVMKVSELKGAKAFELNLLPLGNIDKEDLKDIFAFTEKPVFTTLRRSGPVAPEGTIIKFHGTEEERMKRQLEALELGSNGFDMELDTFDPSPTPTQITYNEDAIKKQEEIIDKAHELGGEVMISCHKFDTVLKAEEAVKIGKIIEERGADMAKIVCMNRSYDDTIETLRGIVMLKRELKIPFVYFGMGEYSKLTRVMGPMLGSMLVYCTLEKIPSSFLWHQPLIENMNAVFSNVDWSVTMVGREERLWKTKP